jgi:hypothetical protein
MGAMHVLILVALCFVLRPWLSTWSLRALAERQ